MWRLELNGLFSQSYFHILPTLWRIIFSTLRKSPQRLIRTSCGSDAISFLEQKNIKQKRHFEKNWTHWNEAKNCMKSNNEWNILHYFAFSGFYFNSGESSERVIHIAEEENTFQLTFFSISSLEIRKRESSNEWKVEEKMGKWKWSKWNHLKSNFIYALHEFNWKRVFLFSISVNKK